MTGGNFATCTNIRAVARQIAATCDEQGRTQGGWVGVKPPP